MPTTDPVGTALASIGAGATTGAAVMTGGVLAFRLLHAREVWSMSTETGSLLLTGSALAGLIAAVATGWLRTRAIDDVWRRGVTGAVSAFGTVLLALGTTVADMVAGPVGVAVYLALLLAAAVAAHQAAGRSTSSGG